MARSGRDYSHDDHSQPGGTALPERFTDNSRAEETRSRTNAGAGEDQSTATADSRVRPASPRRPYPERDRGRPYLLHESELAILVEVASFRTLTVDDLTRYRYGGDRIVRHPGYLAMLIAVPASALAIGPWLALIPGLTFSGVIARRAAVEDSFLKVNMKDYAGYALEVRSRLVPTIW